MKYWLMKSEPESFSIERLEREGKTFWDGVRNYQARNFMMNDMEKGDKVLFYHSNTTEPGVVGLAEINIEKCVPDHTAWEKGGKYYDPKSSPERPVWFMTEVKFIKKFNRNVTLKEIKTISELSAMKLVQKGQRLSIQPVTKEEFDIIVSLANI